MKDKTIKTVLSHIKDDSKEFKKQLSDDVKLKKKLKKAEKAKGAKNAVSKR